MNVQKTSMNIPKLVTNFHRNAAPRYFLANRGKWLVTAIVCTAVGVPPIAPAALTTGLETIEVTREALNIDKSTPPASKLSLIARAGGILLAFAGVLNIAAGSANHVLLPIKKGILYLIVAVITLTAEKMGRVARAWWSVRQLAPLIKTEEDKDELWKALDALPEKLEKKLIDKLQKRGVDL